MIHIKRLIAFLKSNIFVFLIHIYQLLLAIILLTGLFYIRLLPRVSRELWEQLNHYQLLSLCVTIGFVLINIYITLRLMDVIKKKKSFVIIEQIKVISTNLLRYLTNILINLYNFIWYIMQAIGYGLFKIQLLHYHVIRLIIKFILFRKHVKLLLILLLALDLVPRFLFIFAFLYDVFVQQYLHYTFFCIPLLLISLFEKFILFVFSQFFNLYWERINQYIQVTRIKASSGDTYIQHSFTSEYSNNNLPPSPPKVESFRDYYDNHFAVLFELNLALTTYLTWKYQHFPYYKILLVLSVLRLIGLIFMLVYGTL